MTELYLQINPSPHVGDGTGTCPFNWRDAVLLVETVVLLGALTLWARRRYRAWMASQENREWLESYLLRQRGGDSQSGG